MSAFADTKNPIDSCMDIRLKKEKHAGEDGQAEPSIRRLRAGVAARVAKDLAARFPAQRICDALEALPARRCSNAAGWLVRAMITGGWQLHDQAERLRAARTRASQRHDDALATQAQQERRDHPAGRLGRSGSDALTDTQLAAADQRVTRPVGGLDRRSVPVAPADCSRGPSPPPPRTRQAAPRSAQRPAAQPHQHAEIDGSTLPAEIPRPPATPDAAAALTHFDDAYATRSTTSRQHTSHEPKPQGGSNAP